MARNVEADTDPDALVVTTVRLPSSLRDALSKQATRNQRTVSSEIVKRLTDSLKAPDISQRVTQLRNVVANDHTGIGVQDDAGNYFAGKESPHERVLLMLFAELTPERQLALLTLLRGA